MTFVRQALLVASALLCTPVAAQDDSSAGFKYLEVTVLDPQGQPISDVEVEIAIDGTRFPMPTDEEGIVSLNVPAGGEARVSLNVRHEGYVAVGVAWRNGETVPKEFVIPLRKAVSIGGVVHDEEGDPVEGVKVEGSVVTNSSTYVPSGGRLKPYFRGELATTDAKGRWQITTAPRKPMRLRLDFSHPDFQKYRRSGSHAGSWEELLSLENVVVLNKGIEIRGRVIDPDGEPVVGAKVAVDRSRFTSGRQIVETNEQGEFRLTKLVAGLTVLTVTNSDWAPDLRIVTAQPDAKLVDFRLEPPRTVRLRVVDPDGQPIEGVTIIPEEWRGYRALEDPLGRATTNAEGIWEWNAAPADEIEYSIFGQGRLSVRSSQARFSASDEIRDVTMLPAVVVLGNVVDKETGLPIESFRYVEGVWWEPRYDRYILQSGNEELGKNGNFRFMMESGCEKFCLRVEADGYRPMTSRAILPAEREVRLEFELESGTGPRGVVTLPNGQPAPRARLLMATAHRRISIRNGVFRDHEEGDVILSDDEGRFDLPVPFGPFAVVCVHAAGWAAVEPELDEELNLKLQPWARVVGQVRRGQEPMADERVSLRLSDRYDPNRPRVSWSHSVRTNDEGEFTFDRVRAGPATISLHVRFARHGDYGHSANSHTVPVDLRPGETVEVQLGGTGRNVAGQLTIPADYAGDVAWRMGSVSLTEQRHPLGAAGYFHRLGRALGSASVWGTKKSALSTNTIPQRTYAAAIGDDGRFLVHDVPAGKYELTVKLYAVPDGGPRNWNPIGSLNKSVSIADATEENQNPADVGQHGLTMAGGGSTGAAVETWAKLIRALAPE